MKYRYIFSLFVFISGSALGVLLWQFWTPRCNESCPAGVSLSMIVFIAVLPFLSTGFTLAIGASTYTKATKFVLFIISMASISAIVALLTWFAGH